MAPADETEVYHRMHEWYKRPECDALRAAWGAYPATPGALQAWPGFVAVTNAFLDSDAADDRSDAVAATEPVAAEAEASEPVGASDVRPEVVVTEQPGAASETMEREAPAEGGAEEPRGWVSSLLGPRRKSGAEASEAETDQAAGEAVGSLEFIGLWKENKEKDDRLMPIEISGMPIETGKKGTTSVINYASPWASSSTSSFEPPRRARSNHPGRCPAAFSRSQIGLMKKIG